ncbi:unnamed protein product [Rotaria socialis]|uniref:Protein kinase domain-containing protein n=1 Tax=Rotaria socialis TaxID=392032 RepID=A0A818L6U9_9BILA|nr:unnamed protein product [Rotaria socialis]CAF3566998.1 unnamed protein product [Rotaria socialis]CAF4162169.1 unnamed protein product [Rotaria socialis]CAF4407906.1 unnamed protein product [Rotaria socialis]CAF4498125.1 unnamed protein product [Rotaria socialis]
MTTKNLSSTSFKGKINGQRLPPIPVTNEQPATTTTTTTTTANGDHPTSILKKSKLLIENVNNDDDRTLPLDDDELETSRVIFQKSQADVLLLLDTYPPRTWAVPKCLQSGYENTLDQGQNQNTIFHIPLSSDNQHDDPTHAFPSPISDRISSSRYCRRSVSSACSRRSSILFHRNTGVPVDSTKLQRENTFDTVCESLTGSFLPSYTPLPPIPTDPVPNLTSSLTIPPTAPLPSISPPLVTAEQIPAIQEKKDEFTRRLLSKSFHREATVLSNNKTMQSPTVIHKAPLDKPIATTRLSKPTAPVQSQKPIVDNRRVNSVERHVPAAPPIRNKIPTTASSIPTNLNNQRFVKFPLDIFQPQLKSNIATNVTNKKPLPACNKTKFSTKPNTAKVKFNPTISDEEIIQSNNDVIPPSFHVATPNETAQVTNTVKTEESSVSIANNESTSPQTEQQIKLDISTEPKRNLSPRCNSHYGRQSLHPVPQPLSLQGEKPVDPNYPPATARTTTSAMINCQRRGSLKGQPVITELFADSVVETQNPSVKPELMPSGKPSMVKMKKPRRNCIKTAKPKKQITANKPKITPKIIEKIEVKCQNTNSELDQQEIPNENTMIVSGTDWVMAVKVQAKNDEDPTLSQLCEISTIDEEDLPSCASPTDHLDVSQTTLMTSFGDNTRRNSMESLQAVEISPVLTQIIEHPIESLSQNSIQPPKSNEPQLINSDIRTVYETLQDSIRKDTSLRSLPSLVNEQDTASVKPSTTASTTSKNKTLPFETSLSITQTYNNSDTGLSIRPALRVVNDSLNSRGSETLDSTSSHEDYNATPLCTESDCDEIYRTARKGRQVGRGAFGIVWSYLTITGRMIAVKEIELDEGDSERVRNDYESVREEVHILRALTHPYVVKFLGISLENTRLIKIFMEYLPNGTIENMLISFGPFHNDVLKKYTRQIVEGVFYLHQNGVVHRDIKGKNVMLDFDGNIKLIDFGCAKRLKKNQNTHSMRQILKSMKGTANWMAPEVIAETGHGKKADIWSIGCTLCEMATGKPPWSSEHNHLAVLLIIANGTKPPADLPDTCPVSAQEFFRLCLTRDPVVRPSAKDLLAHPFLVS